MKPNKLFVLVMVLVLSISVLSFGADTMLKIEATLADYLNFRVDGEVWEPKDVDGSDLIPIIYNDRTYIPVRSLLEDQGVGVDWDADSQTVILDYAASKPIDKASPLLFERSPSEINIKPNPDFSLELPATIEYDFDLDEDATIFVDGKQMEGSLLEIARMTEGLTISSMDLKVDPDTGTISSVAIDPDFVDDDSDGDGVPELKADIDIDIDISGPPFKFKIRIRIRF